MEADPYSDSMLKSPIVIDNVRSPGMDSIILLLNLRLLNMLTISFLSIGFRSHQGGLWWRGTPSKDIQLIVIFANLK